KLDKRKLLKNSQTSRYRVIDKNSKISLEISKVNFYIIVFDFYIRVIEKIYIYERFPIRFTTRMHENDIQNYE
ncbi:hypothetical protein ACO2IV_18500, partial [Leptospira interrogans]|uniref:hypothetical protein n=1 Tax=Leptospira interrogans TaxID=173 RepID=UPI003D02A71C